MKHRKIVPGQMSLAARGEPVKLLRQRRNEKVKRESVAKSTGGPSFSVRDSASAGVSLHGDPAGPLYRFQGVDRKDKVHPKWGIPAVDMFLTYVTLDEARQVRDALAAWVAQEEEEHTTRANVPGGARRAG